jgi:hypothetical protein
MISFYNSGRVLKITVRDLTGKIILEKNCEGITNGSFDLPPGAAGLYLAEMETAEGRFTQKLVAR